MKRLDLWTVGGAALCALVGMALAFDGAARAETPPPRTILVLDGSGSMWGQIGGRSKIEIAREVIAGLAADAEPGLELGLVAYGHRREGDCADIEMLLPPGPLDPAAFAATVNSVRPKGKTPLSAAVERAAEALEYGVRSATVVLVSDGIETCVDDPCAFAERLNAKGVDFTAHVVGFGVGGADEASLRCLSDATGGRYFSASDAGGLATAMASAVSELTDLDCAAAGALEGRYRYGKSPNSLPGEAEVTRQGDGYIMRSRWTPNPAPGWHYTITFAYSERDCSLKGDWVVHVGPTGGGEFFAKRTADGALFEARDMPGVDAADHEWNGMLFLKQ